MAGGPIFPFSMVPDDSGEVFQHVYEGDGANSKFEMGMGVAASISADRTWHLRFYMPVSSLPSGTGKLRLVALADAVTGDAKVNPKWASVAMGEDPSSATLNAEGTSTLSWSTNDDDEYQELEITLDADTLVADEVVVMDLVFESTNWDLAQVSSWQAMIVWE